MRANDVRECGRRASELLEREAIAEIARACAAVLLGEWQPKKAELGHLLQDAIRDLVVLFDLLLEWLEARFNEVAHGARDQLQLLRDVEVHLSPLRRERYD